MFRLILMLTFITFVSASCFCGRDLHGELSELSTDEIKDILDIHSFKEYEKYRSIKFCSSLNEYECCLFSILKMRIFREIFGYLLFTACGIYIFVNFFILIFN